MNKRILMLTITLLTVAMLATPIVGMVQGGKGQEKLDFRLRMVGILDPPPEKAWPAGVTVHTRGIGWVPTGDFFIEIGVGGSVETILAADLSYEGYLDINQNQKQGVTVLRVVETITIAGRGTLEIINTGANPGQGSSHLFVGHGTGEFEGVKIHGHSTIVGPAPITIDRIGTVMGWPT
jgi:hypothetical protein